MDSDQSSGLCCLFRSGGSGVDAKHVTRLATEVRKIVGIEDVSRANLLFLCLNWVAVEDL